MWSMILPPSAVVVASARPIRALHIRVEAFTGSDDEARQATEKLGAFLNIFHSAELASSPQGTDGDVKAFFDSLKVEQEGQRAVLVATASADFLHKLVTAPPAELEPASPAQTPPVTQSPLVPKPKARHK